MSYVLNFSRCGEMLFQELSSLNGNWGQDTLWNSQHKFLGFPAQQENFFCYLWLSFRGKWNMMTVAFWVSWKHHPIPPKKTKEHGKLMEIEGTNSISCRFPSPPHYAKNFDRIFQMLLAQRPWLSKSTQACWSSLFDNDSVVVLSVVT